MDYSLHLNLTQDIGHGMTLIFICSIAIFLAVMLDLNTGINAARKSEERIKSKNLRRTVNKIIDYYRVVFFGVIIDVLGLAFPWYDVPYCAIIVTIGIVLIEAKSVLENYRKMKSAAAEIPDMIDDIISARDSRDARKVLRKIKGNEYKRAEK